MARRRVRNIRETFVIYESAEDKCWIAHGLSTDQMGYGDCVVDALVEYMRAIDQVLRVASEEKDVQVLRKAPADVRARARSARKLPAEIYEIAYKRVRGRWPKDWSVEVAPESDDAVFKAKVHEPAMT
jgi:hypothetical protein